ncbi:MAG: hypothetical protein JSV51_04700 [Candidatus Bathyarchaeota archaeon]|nr:MAG: hypothetical protein JSV51_04700 [Candidatus Bathyarchaeota archaeon]
MSLKKILSKIERELKERKEIKDELYDSMRKATRLSKQAIFSIHKGQFDEAKKLLKKAKSLFAKRNKILPVHRKLAYAGIVGSAFQEYTEASILLKLIEENKVVSPEEIDVPLTSYLLGLADIFGELRRRALDSLKTGDVKTAEESLETMELVFHELMAMDEALHSISELRRKSDIARRIIEATRGDVAIEVRRNSLERSIEKLERAMKMEKE